MKTRPLLLLLGLAACEPATDPAPFDAPPALERGNTPIFTLTSLGVLPGQLSSEATAINDHGWIVGQSGTQAFWYRSGVMGALATMPGTTYTVAADINTVGHVVGSLLPLGQSVMWSSLNATPTPIVTSLAENYAASINDFDVVVGGGYFPSSIDIHAFRWSAAAGVTDLNPAWASSSSANDINNAGEVAGRAVSTANGKTYAVRWDAKGAATVVGILPGGDNASGFAVYGGRVVGASNTNPFSSTTQGFQWTSGSGITQMAGFSAVHGLSSHQRIAGFVAAAGGPHIAVTRLLSVAGVTTLSTLGGTLTEAKAVNSCGNIAGFSQNSGGQSRAVLWHQPSCDP